MAIREAVRALVVDPDDRVLLVRFEFPTASVWGLPGGGVEPGEAPLAALRRELVEELGLHDVDIGPHIWDRELLVDFRHGATDQRWEGQRDHIHLVRTPAFQPAPTLTWDELARERVHEIRWWTRGEIADSSLWFAPRALAHLLDDLVTHGPPVAPIDCGV